MTKPSFFIVGAPKCGTTALYHYLKQHPDIFMPDRKELHYFGSDLRSPLFVRDIVEYHSLFDGAHDRKEIGEASVWYLYSKNAAREIREYSPEAKIIIMLRNPVDVLYSQHSQFLFSGNENIEDFESALNAEEDRRRGVRVPRTVHFVESLYYRDTVRFSEQVERYFNAFDRKNVHIILFDDFKIDTNLEVRKTLQFLNVRSDVELDCPIVNPNKRIRSKVLRELMNSDDFVRSLLKTVVPGTLRNSIKKAVKRFNTVYEPRRPLDPVLRRKLQQDLSPAVNDLALVLQRDLTKWLN